MQTNIQNTMLYRIRAKGRGWIFSARHFLDYGKRDAVDKALSRLAARGLIRRLGHGIYDYPRTSTALGLLSPSIDGVANEIAAKNNSKLKITGAEAANALGLSTQVPARIVYLTDGPSRQMKIGKQTILLKHTSPRKMSTAGKGVGTVIEALYYIGKDDINNEVIRKIKNILAEPDKKELKKYIDNVPDWMRTVVNEILT